jgi:hypothetical protein
MFQPTPLVAALLAAFVAPGFAQTSDDPTTGPSQFDGARTAVATGIATPITSIIRTPISSSATLVKAAPTSAELRARMYQPWLNQINKPYANQLGAGNGTGVLIGVVDSGVQVAHPSLRGRIQASYNAFNGGTQVSDQMGHGTHVAGILAGNLANGGMLEGVAPNAQLAVAKVFTTGGSSTVTIGRGIDWVVNVQKAPIVSLSLGSSSPSMQGNLQNAVNKGTLVTAALGNEGKASGSWPAKFAREAWAKGQIIAVGALDANNQRASFSNYDATLANWTVFAPGVNVASSYTAPGAPNSYASMSGTSMATPMVAGQAALIKSNWNFLAAPDLAQIIFQSSTRLCSDNVSAAVCKTRAAADAMYGWGLINVGASLQPIGGLNLTSKAGRPISFASASLASAKSGKVVGLPALTSMAVDKFNRGFVVNVGAGVTSSATTTKAMPVSAAPSVTLGAARFSVQAAPVTGYQTALGLGNAADLTSGAAEVLTLGKVSLSFDGANGRTYGMGTGASHADFFGLQSTGTAPLNLSGETSRFNAPYFALASNASHMGYAMALPSGAVLRMGSLVQSTGLDTAMLGTSTTQGSASVTTMELQKTYGAITTVTTVGLLQETDAVLGMQGSGALGIAGNTRTSFLTLAGSRAMGASTTLSAMLSVGTTGSYQNTAASLIDGATASQSMAWSLGVARANVLQHGDSLGLSLSMPLRTQSGSMQVTTATGQSQEDGALSYTTQTLALSPSGMERNLELAYARALSSGTLSAMAQLKFQPGHDAQAATQLGIGLRYQMRF